MEIFGTGWPLYYLEKKKIGEGTSLVSKKSDNVLNLSCYRVSLFKDEYVVN